ERQDIVYLKVPVLSRFARNILALEIRSSIRIGLIEIIRTIFRITSISDIGRNFLSLSLKLPLKIKSQVHSQILFILLRNTGRTRPSIRHVEITIINIRTSIIITNTYIRAQAKRSFRCSIPIGTESKRMVYSLSVIL